MGNTTHTEQERADFEPDFARLQPGKSLKRVHDGYWSPVIAQLAWEILQAAHRAPVVAVPPGFATVPIQLTQKMARAMASQFAGTMGEAANAWSEALAAAPQLPEAAVKDRLTTQTDHIEQHLGMVAAPETAHATVQAAVHANLGTYHRVMAKRAATAAPVQLPEPVGVLHVFTAKAENGEATMAVLRINDANAEKQPLGYHNVVTEQQVRQLLATQAATK